MKLDWYELSREFAELKKIYKIYTAYKIIFN